MAYKHYLHASYYRITCEHTCDRNKKTRLKAIAAPIEGGLSVVVPDNYLLMTPYVLAEQGDWFEDEIKFLRDQLIQSGMKILDIGANYGTYALTMAACAGADGNVWALEPASLTAEFLSKSQSVNGLTQLEVHRVGLSDHQGSAKLYLSGNSELNSLNQDVQREGSFEEVSITTLDDFWNSIGRPELDFIKMDAEGEELRIIDAGTQMLTECSPLIMYELKHGNVIHAELIDALEKRGYRSYALVPGLGTLVPFDAGRTHDSFRLNLFACKDDQMRKLQERGLLVTAAATDIVTEPTQPDPSAFLSGSGLQLPHRDESAYGQVYWLYCASRNELYDASQRLTFLSFAHATGLQLADSTSVSIEQASTLARIAYDYGERATGNAIVSKCLGAAESLYRTYSPSLAFYPSSSHLEGFECGQDPATYMFSSLLLSALEKFSFSTYFSGDKMLPVAKQLESTGFARDKAQRVLNTMKLHSEARKHAR